LATAALAAASQVGIAQAGDIQIAFSGGISPLKLPRTEAVPVRC
jgi:hypothetical protein